MSKMRILTLITAIASLINCIYAAWDHNLSAALGWGVAFLVSTNFCANMNEDE